MCCNTQGKRRLSSDLRPWLRDAVLEKESATVEVGDRGDVCMC